MTEDPVDRFVVSFMVTRAEIRPSWPRLDELVCRGFPEKHLLGYLDSNQEQENQNLPCCQLHHTPRHFPPERHRETTLPYAAG